MDKIRVGVLGATGNVGQQFIGMLAEHPWFELTALAASEKSAGKKYKDVAKWQMDRELPAEVGEQVVVSVDPEAVDADLVFSALPADLALKVEADFAQAGFVVASNASAYRMFPDVPLVIPEVNPEHLGLIDVQRDERKWDGCIITNPNCSTIIMVTSLRALTGFGLESVQVATMQALSGAGYDGIPSMAILDNLLPFIAKEEQKMETETLKLLGEFDGAQVVNADIRVSASCHRVAVLDGHTEALWVQMQDDPSPGEVKQAFLDFDPGLHDLPTEPEKVIIVREEEDRPQPRLDRNAGGGMSVSVGRIREGIRYIVLGHNTIRGAAGASVLNAELLHKKGML
ncbi:MAG: aspartate-semialdehyde dehydrogenase [Mariprofundales bacterium]|nr:aspartate-semialdehyde dehydrogenase [Mariprofundales bacterium]